MDLIMIDFLLFPLARILPFIVVFFMMRSVEKIIPSKMGKMLFYAALFFALAGVVSGEIMWYVLRMPSEESIISLVAIALPNLMGSAFLYLFVNQALHAFGKKSYALSDLAPLSFVFISFLAIFFAITAESEALLRDLSKLMIPPFAYFLYALSLLLIYEIYEKLGIKLSFLALIGSFLMVSSLFVSILPDFDRFLEGSLTSINTLATFFMIDFLQALGSVLSALPAISFYHSKHTEVNLEDLEGALGVSITIYLQKLVDTFGSGVLELFIESFKNDGGSEKIVLREDELNYRIERFIADLCKIYGKVPVKIAKSVRDLRPAAEKVEFYYL